MIIFKVFNDDKMRRWSYFPTMKDPYVLENTILRIINELHLVNGEKAESNFNILDPKIANMYFTYYTSSNFNAWGLLPLSYIYNDMVRHIQNKNTTNNFIMTLESIFFSLSTFKEYDGVSINKAYEIVSSYISENYMNSYNLMTGSNNGIMVTTVPNMDGITFYILAVGFNPYSMAKWYCTSESLNEMDSLPYSRFSSLRGIIFSNLDIFIRDPGANPALEMSDSKLRENINGCNKLVKSYELNSLRRKSPYDTEIKYGNFPLDYNILSMYDSCIPATYMNYNDSKSDTVLTRFNQPEEYITDYRILKRQNDLIRIVEKRKEIGVDN